MKKILILLMLLAAVALTPATAAAAGPSVANGGGRGTVDGVTPFSQFGFGVTVHADGTVRGHFNCLMAGSSRFEPFNMMAMRGRVTSAVITEDAATFRGVGTVHFGNQGKVEDQRFEVRITEGGPQVGTLDLDILGPVVVLDVPPERVLTGHITIH
jgi:hypothetical protein